MNELFDNKLKVNSAFRLFKVDFLRLLNSVSSDLGARALMHQELDTYIQHLSFRIFSGRISESQVFSYIDAFRRELFSLILDRSALNGDSLVMQLTNQKSTFGDLIAAKQSKLFGNRVTFKKLSETHKNAIYFELVKDYCSIRPGLLSGMRRNTYAERRILFAAIALCVYSTYNVFNNARSPLKGSVFSQSITGEGVFVKTIYIRVKNFVSFRAFLEGALVAFEMKKEL
jgi:hypothetical protein